MRSSRRGEAGAPDPSGGFQRRHGQHGKKRIGVALLGVRITLAQITALGALPVAMVVLSVALTIGFGILLARLLGYRNRFGVLTGGAVAIITAVLVTSGVAALLAVRIRESSHGPKANRPFPATSRASGASTAAAGRVVAKTPVGVR